MVRKIMSGEYLKRYDNMTAEERSAYCDRVGEWIGSGGMLLAAKAQEFGARMQNVLAISATWNDTECQAFEEGAALLSSLVGQADTWLPDMLYVKSAKRAVGIMRAALETVAAMDGNRKGDGRERQAVEPDGGKAMPEDSVRRQAGEAKEAVYVEGGAVPSRPKHVDQYVHLLPEKTQEHAARLKDLYRELDTAREKMCLLMDDRTATDGDREAWAKKATATDNKIRRILDELDAGWTKLVKEGRVVVDDLGNARVVAKKISAEGLDTTPDQEARELTSAQKARRRELRKWLVDTRRGNGDTREEHTRKWQEHFEEYLTLEGGDAYRDEKIRAAAAHYALTPLYAEWSENSK